MVDVSELGTKLRIWTVGLGVFLLVLLVATHHALGQDMQAEVNLCLSRATSILSSINNGRVLASLVGIVLVAVVLFLVYLACPYWVRNGWFQTLLVLVIPVGACLAIFWAMTAPTLAKDASANGLSLADFPLQTCRGVLADMGGESRVRVESVLALGEAGSPFWSALGIWPPVLVGSVAVLLVAVFLIFSRRHIKDQLERT